MNMKLNFGLVVITNLTFGLHLNADTHQTPSQNISVTPLQQNIVKLSLADCPEMKTLDTLIKNAPIILLRLRSIAKKGEAIVETITSADILKAMELDQALEKRVLSDHIEALLLSAKDAFDTVRKSDKLILPIVIKILGSKPSLFADYLSGAHEATEFFRKNITSLTILKELCSDLSIFAKSLSVSISKETSDAVKKYIVEQQQRSPKK
ncbi:MAG: hypothetical protein WCT20_04850 [Candidatus Babeliales bacterium]|jgi:hypothetical protein